MTSTTKERPSAEQFPVTDNSVAEGPGSLLKSRREQAQITPMEAASRMNISVQQLHALEANDFANLPAPIFVRNFLSRYAELLSLDAKELIRMYETAGELNQPKLARVSLRESISADNASVRWVTYAMVAMVVVLILVWTSGLGVGTLLQKSSETTSAVSATPSVSSSETATVNEISLPEPTANTINSEEFADLPSEQQ